MGNLRTVGFRIPDELDWAIERLAVDARVEKKRIGELALRIILALAKTDSKACIEQLRSVDAEAAQELQELRKRLARARAAISANA